MTSEEQAALLRQQDRDRAEETGWRITERELDEMAWQYAYEEKRMEKLHLQVKFLKTVQAHSASGYRMMWERTGKSAKQVDLLVEAYKDGMETVIRHLVAAELVEIIPEEDQEDALR